MSRASGALALLLVLPFAAAEAAAGGANPLPSRTCKTRGGTTGLDASAPTLMTEHERGQHEQPPSFAMSWVSRARGGGGPKITADGGGGREAAAKGGSGSGKPGTDDIELALTGNFPNR